jgi:polyisoprenoid-binding protein YceI
VIAIAAVLVAGLGYRWWQVATPAPSSPVVAPVATPVPEPVASDTPDPTPTAEATQAAVVDVPAWTIAPSSTLQFHTTWSGDKINGGFKRFTGTIAFSPDALEQSHVEMHVDTASVFSGDAQRDETLKSADWFPAPALRRRCSRLRASSRPRRGIIWPRAR